MTFEEITNRIISENLFIKETFYTKRTIYEAVTNKDVRVFNITYAQYKKILKTYSASIVKEDYSGFTKRYYKIN